MAWLGVVAGVSWDNSHHNPAATAGIAKHGESGFDVHGRPDQKRNLGTAQNNIFCWRGQKWTFWDT